MVIDPAPPSDLAESAPLLVPDRRIRGLVTLFLRVGLGLSLLNSGLVGYVNRLGMRGISPGGMAQLPFDISQILSYAEIGVGVALVFGFMTTLAASASLLLGILFMLIQTIMMVVYHGQNPQLNQYFNPVELYLPSARLITLMLSAVVLWLSPRITNPYSIDCLISSSGFVPDVPGAKELAPVERVPEPRPARSSFTAYTGMRPNQGSGESPPTDNP